MVQSKVSTLEGNELADDYVRTHVPQGRWADAWDLIKNNFVKLIIINVVTLLFCVPSILLVYFRNAYISSMGYSYPFASNPLGIYPLTPSMQGVPERITLSADIMYMSIFVASMLIACVGLAGACYSIKRLINTHGQFSFKSYFHGIRICYFNVLFPVLVVALFAFACFLVYDWAAISIADGASKGGPITAEVFITIATVIVAIIAFWVLAVGVSYKVKLKYLMKNSIVLLIGTIVQTLFMLAFTLIPVWLLWLGQAWSWVKVFVYVFMLFFGFSFMIVSWFAYTQWVFDMFITPAVKKEEEARKANLTPKQLAAEKHEEELAVAREILAAGKSELVGRPIRPIDGGTEIKEVGVAYSRRDIARVKGDRDKVKDEIDEYYEQHHTEEKYVEYEKMFAEREKALKSDGKKGKKKVGADTLLK